jgi:hypothetical protein
MGARADHRDGVVAADRQPPVVGHSEPRPRRQAGAIRCRCCFPRMHRHLVDLQAGHRADHQDGVGPWTPRRASPRQHPATDVARCHGDRSGWRGQHILHWLGPSSARLRRESDEALYPWSVRRASHRDFGPILACPGRHPWAPYSPSPPWPGHDPRGAQGPPPDTPVLDTLVRRASGEPCEAAAASAPPRRIAPWPRRSRPSHWWPGPSPPPTVRAPRRRRAPARALRRRW